jgi:ssDNA thymidine ADP-ribosyltransferase, DarT
MPNINYLDGYIYHMVHFDNLWNIFQRRALLSKEKVLQEQIPYHSIAHEEVQTLRDRIFIRVPLVQRFRPLHSYVPFYFATRTPMLHVQYKKGTQDEIIIFEASRSLLKDRGVMFTDGNASNQQLAKYGREQVIITPATVLNSSCQRRYLPDGPYGTNQSCSNFYADASFLERLDWDGINNLRHIDSFEEYLRVRHAEVLVPNLLPLGRVTGIVVKTREMVQAVNALLEEGGLAGRIPSALRKPWLFF